MIQQKLLLILLFHTLAGFFVQKVLVVVLVAFSMKY
jgi:hypothetical protein